MARRGGYRGMPRVVPLQPGISAECDDNPHGTPLFTAPKSGLGLGFHGMPWRSVEGSIWYAVDDAVEVRGRFRVVCRGRFCRGWCHGMS